MKNVCTKEREGPGAYRNEDKVYLIGTNFVFGWKWEVVKRGFLPTQFHILIPGMTVDEKEGKRDRMGKDMK